MSKYYKNSQNKWKYQSVKIKKKRMSERRKRKIRKFFALWVNSNGKLDKRNMILSLITYASDENLLNYNYERNEKKKMARKIEEKEISLFQFYLN